MVHLKRMFSESCLSSAGLSDMSVDGFLLCLLVPLHMLSMCVVISKGDSAQLCLTPDVLMNGSECLF